MQNFHACDVRCMDSVLFWLLLLSGSIKCRWFLSWKALWAAVLVWKVLQKNCYCYYYCTKCCWFPHLNQWNDKFSFNLDMNANRHPPEIFLMPDSLWASSQKDAICLESKSGLKSSNLRLESDFTAWPMRNTCFIHLIKFVCGDLLTSKNTWLHTSTLPSTTQVFSEQ